MTATPPATPGRADRQWYIVSRWQEYEAEARANLLRICGIGAFYLIELVNYYGVRLGPIHLAPLAGVDAQFHARITILALLWAMLSLGVLMALRQNWFPGWLKYATTCLDVLLLTSILVVADGPKSPLVVAYFLVLLLAALRFNVRLVQCAAAACVAGYVFLLGYARFGTHRDLRVPRHEQAMVLLALALSGVILGQMARYVRRLAEDYQRRTSPPASGGAKTDGPA